jgi:plastocyanin
MGGAGTLPNREAFRYDGRMLRSSSSKRARLARPAGAAGFCVALVTAAMACSSGSAGTTGGGTTDGGSHEGSTVVDDDAGSEAGTADAAKAVVNACTTFLDKTAGPRTITWSFPLANTDRCWMIKKGQSVTWSADFTMHPLQVQDGDKPSPIAGVDTTTGIVTFPAVGTFGFVCGNHPQMTGAIEVVP